MNLNFSKKLVKWHKNNYRQLVWKEDKDAYSIWLSEIIMQQTRVEYGSQYYTKFKTLFPTVFDLAEADLSEVMKAWEGLGYYSRARNLHATSKMIVDDFDGEFPSTYQELLKLKGVGPYTAAAIGSFAFGISKAAIDGNAYRVLARYYGIDTPIDSSKGKKEFQQLGDELIKSENPAAFNQAMMNLGALVCTPKQVKCGDCPLIESCESYKNQSFYDYPVKEKKLKIKNRFLNYLVILQDGYTYIEERTEKDIWRNLYQFPLIESKKEIQFHEIIKQSNLKDLDPDNFTIKKIIENEKQLLTHQKINATFVVLNLNKNIEIKGFNKIKKEDIHKYAFPKVIHQNIKKLLS